MDSSGSGEDRGCGTVSFPFLPSVLAHVQRQKLQAGPFTAVTKGNVLYRCSVKVLFCFYCIQHYIDVHVESHPRPRPINVFLFPLRAHFFTSSTQLTLAKEWLQEVDFHIAEGKDTKEGSSALQMKINKANSPLGMCRSVKKITFVCHRC